MVPWLAAPVRAAPEIQYWVTSNGARVYFVEARQLPMVDLRVVFDAGAARALIHKGKSLLAVGVTEVRGAFERGQTVQLLDPEEREIARGITHYNTTDLNAIKGLHSNEIAPTLGYEYGPTVVHRDDLVLVERVQEAESA